MLDHVVDLEARSDAEEEPGGSPFAAPVGSPRKGERPHAEEQHEDRDVVDDVHRLVVEDGAEQAPTVLRTLLSERVLLNQLNDVLGLVPGHHDQHQREERDDEGPAAPHFTEPARSPWTK